MLTAPTTSTNHNAPAPAAAADEEEDRDYDVCVFACTGECGRNVARQIVLLCGDGEHRRRHPHRRRRRQHRDGGGGDDDERLSVLLAGRNVEKVRAVHSDLLLSLIESAAEDKFVRLDVHPEPVNVDDDEALRVLARKTYALVNCVDTLAHPRALLGVAEACIAAGTHYADPAATLETIVPVYALRTQQSSAGHKKKKCRIVPGCGFDYAFPDVALAQAERAFRSICDEEPTKAQLTCKIKTGPLGVKWHRHIVERYFRHEDDDEANPVARTRPSGQLKLEDILPPTPKAPVFAYSDLLSAWTVPWFKAKDAVRFLHSRRSLSEIDVRIALPGELWRAALYVAYASTVLVPVLALTVFAKVCRIRLLQRLIIYASPTLSLGALTDDEDLRLRAADETRAELLVVIKSETDHDDGFFYHVSGPSPHHVNHLCLALAGLELSRISADDDDRTSGRCGVLAPAQALSDTDFWTRLCGAAPLEVESGAMKRKPSLLEYIQY